MAAGSGGRALNISNLSAALPFPFAAHPVVAGDTALDHFVPPLIARYNESCEVATAEAKRAEGNHNDKLR
jgi:hypothetical protein